MSSSDTNHFLQTPAPITDRPIPSIKSIAKLAGVNIATVSRALQGNGRMRDETRARILAVAKREGYTPSTAAQMLVGKRSRTIGLIVYDMLDPFHGVLAQAIESEIRAAGYSAFLFPLGQHDDQERINQVFAECRSRQVDGVLCTNAGVAKHIDLNPDALHCPFVLISDTPTPSNLHSVRHDDTMAVTMLIDHLAARGYEQIAFMCNETSGHVSGLRRAAWLAAVHRHNMPDDLHVSVYGDAVKFGFWGMADLMKAHGDRIRSKRSAVWCFSDGLALGALSWMDRNGLRVPADIAVAGFDDLSITAFSVPPLTTWHQPRAQLGITGVRMLLQQMNPLERAAPSVTTLLGHLVIRAST